MNKWFERLKTKDLEEEFSDMLSSQVAKTDKIDLKLESGLLEPQGDGIRSNMEIGSKEEKRKPALKEENSCYHTGLIKRKTMDSSLDFEGGVEPGNCEKCPAGAEWEYLGPGLWCFYDAYFLGKSGLKKKCEIVHQDCPLKGREYLEVNLKILEMH